MRLTIAGRLHITMLHFRNNIRASIALIAVTAISALSQPLDADAASPIELLEHAQALLAENRDHAALDSLNTLIDHDPQNAKLYLQRSKVHWKLQMKDKALADATTALTLEPDYASAYLTRAAIYIVLKRYQDALDDCDKATALDPKLAAAYFVRATAYAGLRNYQKGVEDCNRAVVLDPKNVNYLIARAHAYRDLGQYQKQIDDLTSAARINPQLADIFEQRAKAYYWQKQFQNALTDCTEAIRLDPNSIVAYRISADVYEELGMYDKAIEFRTKILTLDNKSPIDWHRRAMDYTHLHKTDLAEADWAQAKTSTPSELRQTAHPQYPPKFNVDELLKGKSVMVPFQFDGRYNIAIPVQVDNNSLQLTLNTGSTDSFLKIGAIPEVATASSAQMRGVDANGEYTLGYFIARSLNLGGLNLQQVPMCVVSEMVIGPETKSGILGGNILENFVVTVDYLRQQLILSSACEQSDKAIILPMRVRDHVPYCDVELDNHQVVSALVDTGSQYCLAPDCLLESIQKEKLGDERIRGPWMSLVQCEKVRLKNIKVGEHTIDAPIFAVYHADKTSAMGKDIVLGNDFLRRFKTVTFDYPGRRLILEPK